MAYYKTIVNPCKDPTSKGLVGRTRHCDGRKVVMNPQRHGGLTLRGMGYDSAETDKVIARPTRSDEGLKFRTITKCPCPTCWDCTTYEPLNPVSNPKPYTSLRVKTNGWSETCCGTELNDVWFAINACAPFDRDTYLWDESLDLVGGCELMPWYYRYPAADWYGEYYFETVHDCDTGTNDVQWWSIGILLRTMCAVDEYDEESMYAWLRMLFTARWYPWSRDNPETCCLPADGFEHVPPYTYRAMYEGCQKLSNLTRLCGNFLGAFNFEMWHYNVDGYLGTVDCGNAFSATVDLPAP